VFRFFNSDKPKRNRYQVVSYSYPASILVLASCFSFVVSFCPAQETKKVFTVADEIGLAHFGDPYYGNADPVLFSPDSRYVAVHTERGLLGVDCVEDSLRFYRTADIVAFLKSSSESEQPAPVWVLTRSTVGEGPIIGNWRWLPDSTGVAYLERVKGGKQELALADMRRKKLEILTAPSIHVEMFDMRDRQHYVYTARDSAEEKEIQVERSGAAFVGTGRTLWNILFPEEQTTGHVFRHPLLWAVSGGKPFEVQHRGVPIVPAWDLVLSPDGRSVITQLPVPDVPPSWEALYPPALKSSGVRIHGGPQDLRQGEASFVNQYVAIELSTGSVRSLTEGPVGGASGWYSYGSPKWSSDGRAIVIPDTFLKSKDNAPSRPCVAVVDVDSHRSSCVEGFKAHTETGIEEGFHVIWSVRFGRERQRVLVSFTGQDFWAMGTTEYQQSVDGTWQVVRQFRGTPETEHDGLEVNVKQSLNEPPRLVATDGERTRMVWDPNPQLRRFELGEAIVYTWKDDEGRTWKGGLYKPSNYSAAKRYPLVIQTHGFSESQFSPDGAYPTAFAARALAAAGIMVLQAEVEVGWRCAVSLPDEYPCYVRGYKGAVKQMVSDGLVDPDNVGIVGFSRSCGSVMETLTDGSFHLKAASVTDGIMHTYSQYIESVDYANDSIANDANSSIGAPPFGEDLQLWLKRSISFRINLVNTPLLVVAEGPVSIFLMWEPYASLRYLHKPVDLVMLNTYEHVLTNPAVRLASQGGSVDWFRFWLQGYEDPDPAKVEQYARWGELRKLQERSQSAAPTN
jgi:dipeptidyl aminopeptidase/acylaminoacyl peptidase